MEPRFGRDFSGVRVHANAEAAESARAVSARAYTFGNDLVFGVGEFAPATPGGQRLLAHELAHVAGQNGGQPPQIHRQVQEGITVLSADSEAEKNADKAADKVTGKAPGGKSGKQEEPTPPEEKPSKPKKIASCDRNILSEGRCADLVAGSKYICCDPENGLKRDGRKKDIDGTACPEEKFSPIFTCDSTCDKALKKGCSDADNWMALPGDKFKRSACNDVWTICANGKKTTGYVRDRSVTASSFEVSPAIQKALGITVGDSFMGAVYRPGAKQASIDKDGCCNS